MVKARSYMQSNNKKKENSAVTLLNLAGGLSVLKKDRWHYLRVYYPSNLFTGENESNA